MYSLSWKHCVCISFIPTKAAMVLEFKVHVALPLSLWLDRVNVCMITGTC